MVRIGLKQEIPVQHMFHVEQSEGIHYLVEILV